MELFFKMRWAENKEITEKNLSGLTIMEDYT